MNILKPLGKVFNKGLNEKDKKEGLLKRLKNIEDKKEEQLKMIENKESKKLGIISGINIFDEDLPQKAKTMLIKLNNQEKIIVYNRINFKRGKNLEFDFRDYRSLKEIFKETYYWKLWISAEDMQKEFANVVTALEKYKPTKAEYIDKKSKLQDNARKF